MVAVQSVTGQMLALQMSKQNPQAIGALGGFRLKSRPLLRIGVSGERGIRRSNFDLAGPYCRPLLPFGAMPLDIGMRRFHRAARIFAPLGPLGRHSLGVAGHEHGPALGSPSSPQ